MQKLLKSKSGKTWAKQHIIIGLCLLAVLYYLNTKYNWIVLDTISLIKIVVIGILYSMLPDIDGPNTKINEIVVVALIGIIIWSFMNNQQTYGIMAAVILGLLRILGHRGPIHSVLTAVILSLPLLYFGFVYFVVGVLTFVSHIIADNDFSWGWGKDIKIW